MSGGGHLQLEDRQRQRDGHHQAPATYRAADRLDRA